MKEFIPDGEFEVRRGGRNLCGIKARYFKYRRFPDDPRNFRTWQFSATGRGKIQAALALISERFLVQQFMTDAMVYCTHIWHKDLPMDGGGDPHGLVRRIFSALAAASDRWPPMDLSPSDANDGSVARGEVGSILIEAAAEGPKIEGRFAMDIDLSYLDSEGTTIDNLAGTIAHEMMHNLGFTHPGGYKDRNYISVFDFIIERNGRYSPGLSLAGDASGRVCYVV